MICWWNCNSTLLLLPGEEERTMTRLKSEGNIAQKQTYFDEIWKEESFLNVSNQKNLPNKCPL
jgi:hypothetical protein